MRDAIDGRKFLCFDVLHFTFPILSFYSQCQDLRKFHASLTVPPGYGTVNMVSINDPLKIISPFTNNQSAKMTFVLLCFFLQKTELSPIIVLSSRLKDKSIPFLGSQVSDFVFYGSSNLLEPVTKLHLLGCVVVFQGCDNLTEDGKSWMKIFIIPLIQIYLIYWVIISIEFSK